MKQISNETRLEQNERGHIIGLLMEEYSKLNKERKKFDKIGIPCFATKRLGEILDIIEKLVNPTTAWREYLCNERESLAEVEA